MLLFVHIPLWKSFDFVISHFTAMRGQKYSGIFDNTSSKHFGSMFYKPSHSIYCESNSFSKN